MNESKTKNTFEKEHFRSLYDKLYHENEIKASMEKLTRLKEQAKYKDILDY